MAKVKEAIRGISDALETVCGWALCALALYALIFMDLTGNGSAWNSLRGVAREAAPVARVAVLPQEEGSGRDRMLVAPGGLEAPPARGALRPTAAMTDAPAERAAKGDWKVHLIGNLRSFAVYGQGEQATSASVSVSRVESAAPSEPAAPTESVPGSAYRAGASAAARPGIGTRVSRVASGPADSVRNVQGR